MDSKLESVLKQLKDKRRACIQEEDWEGSLYFNNKIIELRPEALRYANNGSFFYRLNRLEESLAAYHRCLELDPSSEQARADFENIKQIRKQKKPQYAEMTDADVEKKLKELRRERQQKLAQKDWEGALFYHDKLTDLQPTALRYSNRGTLLIRLNKLDEAAEAYSIALEIDPLNEEAKFSMQKLEEILRQKNK